MNPLIVESFADMVREKGIDRDILMSVIEETFAMIIRKKYGMDSKFDLVMNMDKGDIEIYLEKTVVEEVTNPDIEITPADAYKKSGEELEPGDEYVEIINMGKDFGRRLIVAAKQNLNQRIREIERDNVFNEYNSLVGEIIVGEVYQIRHGDLFVIHNRRELLLPKGEQIMRERWRKGDTIRAIVKEVRRGGPTSTPVVILSRSDSRFLERLMEIEIPEIYDGIILIKGVAREPGERAKVAVETTDDRVDPVGACVGMKGVRIHSIVRELANENIDIIPWSPDKAQFLARALSPAKLLEVEINEDSKTATVLVSDDQVSLAIGKQGQNVRLASRLTGYQINLVKEARDEEDIELIDFRDVIGADLYTELIRARIDTAKEFLGAPRESLLRLPGMTPERLEAIRQAIESEFVQGDQLLESSAEKAGVSLTTLRPEFGPSDGESEEAEPVPAPLSPTRAMASEDVPVHEESVDNG
ncbi:MAG: transcription termination factor NusA [Bacteroidota bacterium]|nr:transcription termination factor NusA [Bacteroidota bacterium]MDP4232715.1 transcription termination factor NusA [Bacteroidota bacterium]MDP4243152.1 transcription termination factor NusA [Bacteroidota bacterium]MDP4287609.1 transcription termination factor NusA [Bacteroidota bacterium]